MVMKKFVIMKLKTSILGRILARERPDSVHVAYCNKPLAKFAVKRFNGSSNEDEINIEVQYIY